MGIAAAAGIAAVATVGGAVIASSGQKKAANTAAQSAADNSTANNALIRETYAQNAARLDPYSANGLRASNVLNESLGLGVSPPPAAAPPPNALGTQQYGGAIPLIRGGGFFGIGPGSFGEAQNAANVAAYQQQQQAQQQAQQATAATQPSALSAFDTFRNSTNYKFRLDQGNKSLNQGYAAGGMLESGAALKGFADYNQNTAANELGNWQNMLAGQQSMGLGAAGALAGVATNATGSIVASNTNASNTAANAALASGQANAGMWNSVGSALGSVAGSIGRTSYGVPSYGAPPVSIAGTGGNNVGNWTPSALSYTPVGFS